MPIVTKYAGIRVKLYDESLDPPASLGDDVIADIKALFAASNPAPNPPAYYITLVQGYDQSAWSAFAIAMKRLQQAVPGSRAIALFDASFPTTSGNPSDTLVVPPEQPGFPRANRYII